MKDNPRVIYWEEDDGDYVFVNMSKVAFVRIGIRKSNIVGEFGPKDEIRIYFFTPATATMVASKTIDLKKIKNKDHFLKMLVIYLSTVSGVESLDDIIENAMKMEE